MEIYTNKYAAASLAAIVAALFLVGMAMADAPPQTASTSASVTVDEFLSVTIDDIPITFNSMDPGETAKPTNDPLVATIGSETNVISINVKTKAGGTDFCIDYPACAGNKFAVSYLEWNSTDSFPGTGYTTSDATVCPGLIAGGTCNVYHELTIPNAQAAGSYNVSITITATQTA